MNKATAINQAAFEGRLEDVRELLQQLGPSTRIDEVIDHEDVGRGPLHFSVLGKQDQCTLVLLEEYNASPFALDDQGWSPLHVAASVGSVRAIELLLQEVRDRSARAAQETAVAVYCNQQTRVGAQNTALHLAAAKGHDAACLRLLASGARPELRNALGQTALHRAAAAGHALVVAALLEQAAPPLVNCTDRSPAHSTALHLAAEDGHLQVVRLLCDLGAADPFILDANGHTPAHVARTEPIRTFLHEYAAAAHPHQS